MPTDPMGSYQDAATDVAVEMIAEGAWKQFQAYRKAGFSRREALELTKIGHAGMWSAAMMGGRRAR